MNWRGVLEMAVVAGIAIGFGPSSVTAKDKVEQVQKASEIVVATLQREAREGVPDRRELLQAALEAAPDYPPARWHSGFVFEAKQHQWQSVDDTIARGAKDEALAKYQQMRIKAPETIPGQLELASWCDGRKLEDQARAHLTRVLDFNPDHTVARRLLGFVLINGTWISQQEIADAQSKARESAIAAAKWIPRLQDLRATLARGGRQQARAKQDLMEIREPAASGAIETVFLSAGGPLAAVGIEMLTNIRGPEAAAALAWHAVFSPLGDVQEAAARALSHQDKHDYVPLMLATMRSPIQSRWQVYERGPQLFYRHMLYAEAAGHRDLVVLDDTYRNQLSLPRPRTPEELKRDNPLSLDQRIQFYQPEFRHDAQAPAVALDRARLSANMRAIEREMAVAQHNRNVSVWNGQLSWALSEATGDFRTSNPEEWWDWWYNYNEVVCEGERPLRTYYQYQWVSETIPRAVPNINMVSCLAAGTLVWTESGAVPVQDIRVGDRVFACDPETGCLGLKPVLKTTIRAKSALLKISAGGDTIQATGGHVLWVSGKGWMKARDLQPERRLHTLLGTVDVASVESGEVRETYNLVVADFHTYFIGDAKLLTHDTTIRRPMTCVVPGLTRQTADTADFFRR